MNVDKLTEIAEWLEAGAPERDYVNEFHMANFIRANGCGTSCCIAGAAVQFECHGACGSTLDTYSAPEVYKAAKGLLGLSEETAQELFYAESIQDDRFKGLNDIGPQWAARVIRHLIATGRVEWLRLEHA